MVLLRLSAHTQHRCGVCIAALLCRHLLPSAHPVQGCCVLSASALAPATHRSLIACVHLQSAVAIVLCMLDVSASGLLVACGRMRVLVRAMGITLGATGAYFTLCALQGVNSLSSVWWGLVLFFIVRLCQSLRAMTALYA